MLGISIGRTDLQPQSCALAHCGQLRRLKVCKAQRGQFVILTCESREAVDYDCELLEDKGKSGAEEDEIRVAAMIRSEIRNTTDRIDRTHSVT